VVPNAFDRAFYNIAVRIIEKPTVCCVTNHHSRSVTAFGQMDTCRRPGGKALAGVLGGRGCHGASQGVCSLHDLTGAGSPGGAGLLRDSQNGRLLSQGRGKGLPPEERERKDVVHGLYGL
jgi:hypothetical protein